MSGPLCDLLATGYGPRLARLDDRAETVCAEYRVANARIHIINGLLGGVADL